MCECTSSKPRGKKTRGGTVRKKRGRRQKFRHEGLEDCHYVGDKRGPREEESNHAGLLVLKGHWKITNEKFNKRELRRKLTKVLYHRSNTGPSTQEGRDGR